jgi:sulfopyruvate decarboxylase TPP-binding subunit
LDAIKDSGVETIVSVPDIVTSEGLLRLVSSDADIRHVPLCKEDEGISICTALSYCGKRSLLMMQQTGMYDSVNSIRAIAVGYGHPVCMLIGLQGAEAGVPPNESDKHIVRVAQPVLDALEVEHHLLSYASDVDKIKPAIDKAYETSRPVALLVGAMLPPA